MKPRCPGTKTAGEWTGFQCVLDEGHAEKFCQPYVPPTVDEWRWLKAWAIEAEARASHWAVLGRLGRRAEIELAAALDREKHGDATRDRLQAELDALRAVVESGRDLDAEVLRAVQTQRDDLAVLARKGDA